MALKVKVGDKVIMKGFTGIKLGIFEIADADAKSVTIFKKDGSELIFSKKTGKQINCEEGKERYANSIMEDDGSYVAPNRGKRKKKDAEKAVSRKKKERTEPVEEIINEDEENSEEFVDDDEEFIDDDEEFIED